MQISFRMVILYPLSSTRFCTLHRNRLPTSPHLSIIVIIITHWSSIVPIDSSMPSPVGQIFLFS
jgi:hypothetical protein